MIEWMDEKYMIPDIDPEEFTYNLPEERIAKHPLPRRDKAKLLVYHEGNIQTSCFCDLDRFLRYDDVLVINNTKVIRARLFFNKPTGARIEIFCLEPVYPSDYERVFNSREPVTWECLIGNAKKWKEGVLSMRISVDNTIIRLTAKRSGSRENASLVEFFWDQPTYSFGQLLEAAGAVPIPPYLKREATESDTKEYQTVYAEWEGSVAAPTAGLHFTPDMLDKMRRQHKIFELTLHVGAGTFKPIQTGQIGEHIMHTEHFSVSRTFLEDLPVEKGRIIAVGTTTVRTLESLYWLAIKLKKNKNAPLFTGQWDPYKYEGKITAEEALDILLEYMGRNHIQTLNGSTRLMIVPGYRFRFINGLITNFHLPKSTLLLLIAAFTGGGWKRIYQYALEHGYRFLSYGDASLLFP